MATSFFSMHCHINWQRLVFLCLLKPSVLVKKTLSPQGGRKCHFRGTTSVHQNWCTLPALTGLPGPVYSLTVSSVNTSATSLPYPPGLSPSNPYLYQDRGFTPPMQRL